MREGQAMKRKTRASSRKPSSTAPAKIDHGNIWTRSASDAGFPAQILAHPSSANWGTIYGFGNADILQSPCVGLMCSVKCPGSIVIRTFDAVRELRDAGVVVAGGFHSPMEQECLDFLLRGEQPVIVCPARHPPSSRFSSDWKRALDSGRLLLLSSFAENVRRATKETAQLRNEFVAALAAVVLVPHASQGGKVEATTLSCLNRHQSVFTLDDAENESLTSAGALTYSLETVAVQHLRPAGKAPRGKKSKS